MSFIATGVSLLIPMCTSHTFRFPVDRYSLRSMDSACASPTVISWRFRTTSHHFRIRCLALSGSQRSASFVSVIGTFGFVSTLVLSFPSHRRSISFMGEPSFRLIDSMQNFSYS